MSKLISLQEAEILAMQTDYACFANEDTGKINKADAAAFYMEGYNTAISQMSTENAQLKEALREFVEIEERIFGLREKTYVPESEVLELIDKAKQLLTEKEKEEQG